MDIKFSDEQMRALVTKAIIEGLGEDQKIVIITKAIEYLMGPANSNSYNDKRTRLEIAFEDAMKVTLHKIALEELEKPERKDKIKLMFAAVVDKALSGDGMSTLSSHLVTALSEGLRALRDKY